MNQSACWPMCITLLYLPINGKKVSSQKSQIDCKIVRSRNLYVSICRNVWTGTICMWALCLLEACRTVLLPAAAASLKCFGFCPVYIPWIITTLSNLNSVLEIFFKVREIEEDGKCVSIASFSSFSLLKFKHPDFSNTQNLSLVWLRWKIIYY